MSDIQIVVPMSGFGERFRRAGYGVPKPQHAIWREHATLSQELLPYVGHGWIKVKPNVKELLGTKIRFEDGSEEHIDEIVYATGYKTTSAMFEDLVTASNSATSYTSGGVTASGPAVLIRKSLLDRVSLTGSYFVDMVSNASIDVIAGGEIVCKSLPRLSE